MGMNGLMDYANFDGDTARSLPCRFHEDGSSVFFSFVEDGEQAFRGEVVGDGHWKLTNTTGNESRLELHRMPGDLTLIGFYVYPGSVNGFIRVYLE